MHKAMFQKKNRSRQQNSDFENRAIENMSSIHGLAASRIYNHIMQRLLDSWNNLQEKIACFPSKADLTDGIRMAFYIPIRHVGVV